ncbi:MAG: hypothetical protein J0H99_21370 [Rhodospirillales bacterium]|nr:hypothetical protein [Rhodospirillales bacterium]
MAWRIGVDIGGTFTDVALVDDVTGRIGVAKALTTPKLEEKGARAVMVTTRGFRDVLELRRSSRPDLYDLFQDAPATLVPRHRRFEITERIGADGKAVTPLAEGEIAGLIA